MRIDEWIGGGESVFWNKYLLDLEKINMESLRMKSD